MSTTEIDDKLVDVLDQQHQGLALCHQFNHAREHTPIVSKDFCPVCIRRKLYGRKQAFRASPPRYDRAKDSGSIVRGVCRVLASF